MTRITKRLRDRVRKRAGNRCEYCLCHQNYVFGQLQIDHVIPIAKGGIDTELFEPQRHKACPEPVEGNTKQNNKETL